MEVKKESCDYKKTEYTVIVNLFFRLICKLVQTCDLFLGFYIGIVVGSASKLVYLYFIYRHIDWQQEVTHVKTSNFCYCGVL